VGVVAGIERGMEMSEAGVVVDPDGRGDFCFQISGESTVVFSSDVLNKLCEVGGECDGCEPGTVDSDICLAGGDAFPDSIGGGEEDFGEFINMMVSDLTSGEGFIDCRHLVKNAGVPVAGSTGPGRDAGGVVKCFRGHINRFPLSGTGSGRSVGSGSGFGNGVGSGVGCSSRARLRKADSMLLTAPRTFLRSFIVSATAALDKAAIAPLFAIARAQATRSSRSPGAIGGVVVVLISSA
jgi:hypothetical protein